MSLVTFSKDVRDREGADVTAGASERNPRRRRILAALVEHFRQPIGQYVGPVRERARKTACDAVAVEQPEAVADRDPELVAIDACQRRQNVDRRMGNQRCVVVRK